MSNEISKITKHSAWIILIMAIFSPPALVRAYGWIETWLTAIVMIIGFALLVSWTFTKKDQPLSVKAFSITAWLMVTGLIIEGFGFMYK